MLHSTRISRTISLSGLRIKDQLSTQKKFRFTVVLQILDTYNLAKLKKLNKRLLEFYRKIQKYRDTDNFIFLSQQNPIEKLTLVIF